MASKFTVRTVSGPLNATIEFVEGGFAFHSRSGRSTNRDYRPALEAVLARLDAGEVAYEIYLDSRPSRGIDLSKRKLPSDARTIPARFNQLVRAMNANSSSNGAWRRLLILTPSVSEVDLRRILIVEPRREPERLPANVLRTVTSEHIRRAAARLLAGEDAPNFGKSTYYDVLTDDAVPLAPKKVFGLALEDALGIEAFPAHFEAGADSLSFKLLRKSGLWIAAKADAAEKIPPAKRKIPVRLLRSFTDEERLWIEGNPKMVHHLRRERSPGLAKRKVASFIAEHGRLFCEDCRLDPTAQYGEELGSAAIEVHHSRVQVSRMQPGHRTELSDLRCLCANCHRVLHRRLARGIPV